MTLLLLLLPLPILSLHCPPSHHSLLSSPSFPLQEASQCSSLCLLASHCVFYTWQEQGARCRLEEYSPGAGLALAGVSAGGREVVGQEGLLPVWLLGIGQGKEDCQAWCQDREDCMGWSWLEEGQSCVLHRGEVVTPGGQGLTGNTTVVVAGLCGEQLEDDVSGVKNKNQMSPSEQEDGVQGIKKPNKRPKKPKRTKSKQKITTPKYAMTTKQTTMKAPNGLVITTGPKTQFNIITKTLAKFTTPSTTTTTATTTTTTTTTSTTMKTIATKIPVPTSATTTTTINTQNSTKTATMETNTAKSTTRRPNRRRPNRPRKKFAEEDDSGVVLLDGDFENILVDDYDYYNYDPEDSTDQAEPLFSVSQHGQFTVETASDLIKEE